MKKQTQNKDFRILNSSIEKEKNDLIVKFNSLKEKEIINDILKESLYLEEKNDYYESDEGYVIIVLDSKTFFYKNKIHDESNFLSFESFISVFTIECKFINSEEDTVEFMKKIGII